MTVLVTGGEGFLGSHLVDRLRADGEDPSVSSRHEHDLVDPSAARRLFEATRPEVVFHLAAEVGGIGANRAQPGRFWYANLAMGMNVLEECRRVGVKKLVLVGTVCAYPKMTRLPFRETDLWSGYPDETNAPYGIAKRTLLTGAYAYREQYGLNAIYLVPANLYGPRDNFDPETSHVIPAIVRKTVDAVEKGAPRVVLWGDGSRTREFLYVEDCADALVRAASQYDRPEPVNLGTGEEISIRDLAALIGETTGFEGEFVWDSKQPGGQPRRRLDVDRAAERFDFRARTPLRDGLERTVAWFIAHGPSPLAAR
jgi:GDP-L-fucose synthase